MIKSKNEVIRPTVTRVQEHTPETINQAIRQETENRLKLYIKSPAAIDYRLKELDREWDIERTLETNGSALLLIGLTFGVLGSRRWLALPVLVGSFCLQHALQGWCPPIELFRRMGIRTSREIEEERTALKILRGDFKEFAKEKNSEGQIRKIMQAVHRSVDGKIGAKERT